MTIIHPLETLKPWGFAHAPARRCWVVAKPFWNPWAVKWRGPKAARPRRLRSPPSLRWCVVFHELRDQLALRHQSLPHQRNSAGDPISSIPASMVSCLIWTPCGHRPQWPLVEWIPPPILAQNLEKEMTILSQNLILKSTLSPRQCWKRAFATLTETAALDLSQVSYQLLAYDKALESLWLTMRLQRFLIAYQ